MATQENIITEQAKNLSTIPVADSGLRVWKDVGRTDGKIRVLVEASADHAGYTQMIEWLASWRDCHAEVYRSRMSRKKLSKLAAMVGEAREYCWTQIGSRETADLRFLVGIVDDLKALERRIQQKTEA